LVLVGQYWFFGCSLSVNIGCWLIVSGWWLIDISISLWLINGCWLLIGIGWYWLLVD
jgi:hypothetical protein